jgi:hypothetical protein
LEELGLYPVVVHAKYLINLASRVPELFQPLDEQRRIRPGSIGDGPSLRVGSEDLDSLQVLLPRQTQGIGESAGGREVASDPAGAPVGGVRGSVVCLRHGRHSSGRGSVVGSAI